jgi:hypothetical protein
MPFCIVSGSTHHCDLLSSQSEYSDGVDCPPVEDGVPDAVGVAYTELLNGVASSSSVPELLGTVDSVVGETPVVGPVIPLLSLTVIDEKLAVGEAPVVGPVIPLLSLTDIEEKLTVCDPKIPGGT